MDMSRREVIVTAVAASLSAAARAAPSQTEATGRVFEAGTQNPIPGVRVSNGRDIVATGDSGLWSLPVREGDSIFVIKPRDWMVPLELATHLPRFAYVHQPDGTPPALGLRYAGIAPTGPLPASIDFALTRADEPDRFNVLLFTDPQPESDAELSYVRDTAVTLAAAENASFGITTGDVMFDDLSMYGRHNRIFGALNLPWWNLPGNHDMNYEAPDNRFSRETFKRLYGARHYAFQYGPATFVMLDNVDYLGGNKYQGRIGEDQLDFVRALFAPMADDAPVIICMHIPLRTAVGGEADSATTNYQALLDIIGTRTNCVSFAGHTHTNEHHYLGSAQHHHHVMTAVSGSWWSGPYDMHGVPVALASDGTPNGFHVLTVDGGICRTRLVSAESPGAAPLRVMVDSHFTRKTRELALTQPLSSLLGATVARDALPAARLLVNFFPGGPRSTVHVSDDSGGLPRAMTPTAEIDPFVQQLYWRNEATKKPWVQPVKSTHLWSAGLPGDMAVGAHRLTITATDEFGATYETGFVLEVTA